MGIFLIFIGIFAGFFVTYLAWQLPYFIRSIQPIIPLNIAAYLLPKSFQLSTFFIYGSINAILLSGAFIAIDLQNEPLFNPVILGVFLYFLLLIALIDLEHFLIPDVLLIIVVIYTLSLTFTHNFPYSFAAVCLNALIGFFILWIPAKLFFILRKKHGLGGGDPKLFAITSMWIPLDKLPLVLLITSFSALIFMLFTQKSTQNKIPLAPFICFSTALALIFNDLII